MKLKDYLSVNNILVNEDYADKNDLLGKMVTALAHEPFFKHNPDASRDEILKSITTREELGSTGAGCGLAFPHARMQSLTRVGISIAIPQKPIEYEMPDNSELSIACMVVSSESAPTVVLKIISTITKFLALEDNRKQLQSCEDAESVLKIIGECRLAMELPVYASDIMRAPKLAVRVDTPLKDVTKQMHALALDAVSVLDEQGHIVGEITSDLLFKLGIPDFFQQLKSISFVREFDPFEQYFSKEAESTARDVMSEKFAIANESDTLMEIIFLLAVRGWSKVYVVDESGIRVGIIDRHTVLDRVINF